MTDLLIRDPNDVLTDIDRIRSEMETNFHLYEEVRALPPSDQDALFNLLYEAQSGRPDVLEAIHTLVYDEIPVDMEEFILGSRYMALKGLINQEKVDLLVEFDRPQVRKAWIAAGSGSGKSFMVSLIQAREVYKLLCLRRPDLYYLLGPGSKIACINLSVSKEQARDVIFAEFMARIRQSPWFINRPYTAMSGRAIFSKCGVRDAVATISGGSVATSYYGYHTFMGSIDEVSFMFDGDRSVAEDLVEALIKSMITRFPRAYKFVAISTLRSSDDYLYQQIERLKTDGVLVRET